MIGQQKIAPALRGCIVGILLLSAGLLRAETDAELQMKLLLEQNRVLLEKVDQQNKVIESLSAKVAKIEATDAKRDKQLEDLKTVTQNEDAAVQPAQNFNFGKVHISGEGGVGFFSSHPAGAFPNSEFRVDEAKLFVEAPVWEDVYFYSELNLATRENEGLGLDLGELYLDFEDISKWLWGHDRNLNVRAGRMDIPFGEEYLSRDAIDNPLISHSLSDIWGVDEGVELYGSAGKFSYVFAVQNGGIGVRDYNSDKAIVGRIAYDPTRWLHLSVSGMHTGDLDANNDYLSEVWFGNGWFRSMGSTNTTKFGANVVEGDIIIHLPRGHISAFAGYINYYDNDPEANNSRDVFYYSVEGEADITRKFYTAARFSQIIACKGFPISGNGDYNDDFYDDLTKNVWRFSVGGGYRFSPHLALKAEYTLEQGETVGGDHRNANVFSAEAAFGF